MTTVRSFDYRHELPEIRESVLEAVERVIQSGHLILGPEVQTFEHALADYLGGGHGIGVASGTDAITVCLMARGIGHGDEVITVSNTATATANAIVRSGATPVFCDIDPTTALLDIEHAVRLVTPRTKAIVPVHLYGNMVDIPRLVEAVSGTNIFILEDCAQALGATLRGHHAGTLADAGAYSFYPTKNLGAYGDGGFCFTKSESLAEIVREVRRYGFAERDYAVRPGLNSRLDELHAAILSVKLPYLARNVERRRTLAAIYDAELGTNVTHFSTTRGCENGRHLYVVQCEQRDRLVGELREAGIETGVHYRHPIHRMPAFAAFSKDVHLPHTERACDLIVSLPLYPGLSDDEVLVVCQAVKQILRA